MKWKRGGRNVGQKRIEVREVGKKLSLCLTNQALRHEGVWGSGYIDPHLLDLGTSWRWMVSFTPLSLYPRGKSPRCLFHSRLGRPQSRSGWRGEKKNCWLYRDSNSDPSVVQPVASRYTDFMGQEEMKGRKGDSEVKDGGLNEREV
jgi:hypothetical protein